MNPVHIITQKRDGRELDRGEIAAFIQGFSAGRIPNYQMSALTMAIYFKGMTADETSWLTEELLASGRKISWTGGSGIVVEETSSTADSMPRLERTIRALGTLAEQANSSGTLAIDEDDCGLDARDTVDLGEDSSLSQTLLLDGSAKQGSESGKTGLDTVDLEALAVAMQQQSHRAVVDKLSMGSLGDKTSLILAPLLACCGLRVPMISGRSLGLPATPDKMDSIPGLRTDLSLDEIREITDRVGCVIAATPPDLAPAERKLHSLREVTATATSIPLLAASMMSKKLAEGVNALLFDLKWGGGAFLKTLSVARKLADALVEIGRRRNVKVVALLSNTDQPFGRMIGNALEVDEALSVLSGQGPADVWTATCELAAELLIATGVVESFDEAQILLNDHAKSGRAVSKFREMVMAQGGTLDQPRPVAPSQFEMRAVREGYVGRINADAISLALVELGGARRVLSDVIDPAVGLEILVRVGDRVEVGQPLIRVHGHAERAEAVLALLRTAVPIRAERSESAMSLAERIG